MSRKKFILLMTLCMNALLAGCMKIEEQEEITLYVQEYSFYYSDFMQKYGIPFELQHDNIRVEVSEYIYDEEDPEYADLLYLYGFTNYEDLVAKNKLAPLDGWVMGHDGALSNQGFARTKAIEVMRTYSEGQLFALPFDLQSEALYYNADLFDQYDVQYPSDIVSWEEVFQLASQFPTANDKGQPIFGLTHGTTAFAPFTTPDGEVLDEPANDMLSITSSDIVYRYIASVSRVANLSMWNDQWKMTMNTPEWEQLLNDIIPNIQAGHIDIHLNQIDPFSVTGHPFWDGRAAMFVSDLSTAEYLAKKSEDGAFHWNVVAGPIHPGHPVTTNYHFKKAYGINSQSSHKEEAWQLLKFMFEQTDSTDEIAGVSLEPFYVLDAEKYVYSNPPVNYAELYGMISRILYEVVEDRLSIKEALVQIQEEGQRMLDNLRFEYENSLTGEGADE